MEYHTLEETKEAKEAMNMRAFVGPWDPGSSDSSGQVQHSIVGTNAKPYLPDANITQRKPQNWGRSLMSISRSAMVLNMMKQKCGFSPFPNPKKICQNLSESPSHVHQTLVDLVDFWDKHPADELLTHQVCSLVDLDADSQ